MKQRKLGIDWVSNKIAKKIYLSLGVSKTWQTKHSISTFRPEVPCIISIQAKTCRYDDIVGLGSLGRILKRMGKQVQLHVKRRPVREA